METRRKKCLIIEDEVSDYLDHFIELDKEHDVIVVSILSDAIEYLTEDPLSYDFVILDIMMPPTIYDSSEVRGGLETGIKFYNENLINKKIKVIVWTRFYKEASDCNLWGKNVLEIVEKEFRNKKQLLDLINKY